MGVLRRAIWGVFKNWNNLVLGSLIVVSCLLLFFVFTVNEILSNSKKEIEKAVQNQVTLSFDNTTDNFERLNEVNISNILRNSGVDYIETNEKIEVVSSQVTPVFSGKTEGELFQGKEFTAQAVNIPDFKELKYEKIKIVSGEGFSQDNISTKSNVMLISYELSQKNNLKLGDSIEVRSAEFENGKKNTLKIIGIYEWKNKIPTFNSNKEKMDFEINYSSMKNDMYQNQIYVIDESIMELMNEATGNETTDFSNKKITFYLKKDYDSNFFVEETKKYLPKGYRFLAGSDSFSVFEKSINSIERMTNSLTMIVCISLFLLLFIFQYFILKKKIKEIAIYLSLGESEKKVIFQLIIESVFIIMIGYLIAISIFFIFIQNNISDFMKENFIKNMGDSLNNDLIGYDTGVLSVLDIMSYFELRISNTIFFDVIVTLILGMIFPIVSIYLSVKRNSIKINLIE